MSAPTRCRPSWRSPRRLRNWRSSLGLAILAAGCGSSPTTPTPPAPTTTSVRIDGGTALLHLGAEMTLTARALLSDGTSRDTTATAAWSVTAGVASIVSPGRVRGLASGTGLIQVGANGQTATQPVRVLPHYQGGWLGSYVITSCTATGSAATTGCQNFAVNQVLPLAWQVTQDEDRVAGVTALGAIVSDTFTAPIRDDGFVVVLARAQVGGGGTFDQTWRVTSTVPGQMTGELDFVIRDSALSGTVTVTARLINTHRQ